MNTLKQNKAIIRSFMRAQYTDAKLVELLDHARAGKLAFLSCCCFIGIPTAEHELQGWTQSYGEHYITAKATIPGAEAAETAYRRMWIDPRGYGLGPDPDTARRRILIPMVLAEIQRRAKAAQPAPNAERVEVGAR